MASFSGIASEVCDTGSNFLVTVLLICHENLGSTDLVWTEQMLYNLLDTAVNASLFSFILC